MISLRDLQLEVAQIRGARDAEGKQWIKQKHVVKIIIKKGTRYLLHGILHFLLFTRPYIQN